MKEKKSFILYLDNAKQVNMLTDEQAGKFIKAVYKFAETGEETEFDDIALNIVYSFIADNIKRDTAKYQETCMRRSENGKKGGRPPKAEKANGFSENQNKAKKADNDNENEIENDIVNENENEKENEKIQQNFSLKNPSSSPEINSFIENFNNICKSFNSVSKISDTDKQNIMEIISNFNKNEIIETFEKIQKSSFLKGNKNNSDGKYKDWKANFSWLIKYDHFLSAFNGNYDDNGKHSGHYDADFDTDMYKQFINDYDVI